MAGDSYSDHKTIKSHQTLEVTGAVDDVEDMIASGETAEQ